VRSGPTRHFHPILRWGKPGSNPRGDSD
jgi:hypothetical protein